MINEKRSPDKNADILSAKMKICNQRLGMSNAAESGIRERIIGVLRITACHAGAIRYMDCDAPQERAYHPARLLL